MDKVNSGLVGDVNVVDAGIGGSGRTSQLADACAIRSTARRSPLKTISPMANLWCEGDEW